jgi:hypothetical protein
MTLLDQIRMKSNVEFRPATAPEIRTLQAWKIPQDALSFFQNSVPTRIVEIGKVRLCTVAGMAMENRDAVPGCYAFPCGYIVFATNIYGDSFCFDVRSEKYPASSTIVLIAHDLEPENDEMKREDLAKLAKPVATSFGDFLQGFVSGTLDIEPLYPPFDSGNERNEVQP